MNTQNLNSFTDHLAAGLKSNLENLEHDSQHPLVRFSRSLCVARDSVLTLKAFIHTYAFKDKAEEIQFFKLIKPKFLSQYLYYQQLIELYTNQPPGSKEDLVRYYQHQQQKSQTHLRENLEFHLYCLSDATQEDEKYFLRSSSAVEPHLDAHFTTTYDTILAQRLANELLGKFLATSMERINLVENATLTWTGPKTALVELAYALHSMDMLNGGKIELKQLTTAFENIFNISLGNYYRTFQEIRLRKTGRTNFLDQLKNKFIQRMDEMD